MSNVLTMTARGNVSYSVRLTTSATLPSTLIVPQILRMTVRDDVDSDGFKSVTMLMLTVVLPVVAKQLLPTLCRLYTSSCQHGRESRHPGDHCVEIAVGLQRERLQVTDGRLIGLLLLINVGCYLAGYPSGVGLWR